MRAVMWDLPTKPDGKQMVIPNCSPLKDVIGGSQGPKHLGSSPLKEKRKNPDDTPQGKFCLCQFWFVLSWSRTLGTGC